MYTSFATILASIPASTPNRRKVARAQYERMLFGHCKPSANLLADDLNEIASERAISAAFRKIGM